MSAAAVFLLIANDGKSDRMIMATQLLNQRIKDIMQMRRAGGKSDITPTLVDIERTHLLYVNAHFKPYAAIAYEYNKVRPQTGGINFGNSMQFSIPQFGDFFFDMVVNVGLPSVTGTKISFPSTPPILQSFLPSGPTQHCLHFLPNLQIHLQPQHQYPFLDIVIPLKINIVHIVIKL